MIIRGWLLKRGYPIHYYTEGLFHSSNGLRELSFDTLKIINTVRLPVGDYKEVDLPDDFVDDLGVSIPVGDRLQPIPKNDTITPLRAIDTTGIFALPNDPTNTAEQTVFAVTPTYLWFWNINDWGEPTGRYFGAGGGAKLNGYRVVKERRQIQLTGTFSSDSVVLMYISNGLSVDNATQVDVQAIAAIQSYIDWQRSPNAAIKDSAEARTFYNERRVLRSRMNDLTITDLKNIFRSQITASIKN